MTRYLHGFNDIGGEQLHGDRPGWTLINEQVGLNTSHGGGNYDAVSNRGIGVVVRMNHAYGSGGTIPLPAFYREYAQACASFARNSSPVDYFIVANEPNLERPNGVVITPAEYARCFAMTYEAIKKAKPAAKIVPAALAPYNASPMPWIDFMALMLEQIAMTTGCDAVNFHAYARSMNPQNIYSEATMDDPLEGLYYGFKTCEDALLKGTPSALRKLPAMNTEFDIYDAWEDRNTGIITEHYKYFDARNAVEGNQKVIMSLCFRWLTEPDVINEKDWGMRNKPNLLADFRAAVAHGYQSPQVGAQGQEPMETHLPSIANEPTVPQVTLPEREFDPRLKERGVTIDVTATHDLAPGQTYWRIAKVRWWNVQESQGRHHIYVEALDEGGKPRAGIPFLVQWPSGKVELDTNGRSGFDAGNYPMSKSLSEFSVKMTGGGYPSETLSGIGMGDKGNSGIHTSTGVVFQLVTMPAVAVPAHPPVIGTGALYVNVPSGSNIRRGPSVEYELIRAAPYATPLNVTGSTPSRDWLQVEWEGTSGWVLAALLSPVQPVAPTPAPQEPVQGDNWERSIAWTLKWEGGLSITPDDHGNWTGGRKGQGELKGTNFGISAASYPHLDIRNLTREQAVAIYERDYWQASGAAQLEWPACLLVFDTSVLHGVGAAQAWLQEAGPSPYAFAAKRLRVYTKLDNWNLFGKAWVNRTADLLEEMAA